jgi:hypothetical protein
MSGMRRCCVQRQRNFCASRCVTPLIASRRNKRTHPYAASCQVMVKAPAAAVLHTKEDKQLELNIVVRAGHLLSKLQDTPSLEAFLGLLFE